MTPAPATPARFLVQYQSALGEGFDVDYATGLSRTGLVIAASTPLAPQSTLHVHFAPRRDSQLVSAFCRVTDVTAEGVQAEFLGLDAESARVIESALV